MRQLQQLAGFLRRRRGSVSVEFALVSVFFLGPLFGGGADFVVIMAAQAQLRTAVQALDYFAWTNPGEANNLKDAKLIIGLINQHSDYQITLPATLSAGGANGALSFSCFTPPATANTTPTSPSPATCPSTQTQLTLVTYQVTTNVFLPAPLPGIFPSQLSVTSTVQIR
jgi:Flp pilus assembly protein TadG